ncbi:MAG TPA: Calx-beta domain-containing protein [Thermoanaerobaculia bacterium]|jgi:plastocyanin|nr:Calx-beta domain-containing protein [Thermoanaerobaculia bacterium]
MPYRRAFGLTALIVALAMPSQAATVEVHVGGTEFAFNPATVTLNVGDTVRWTNDGGFHNVRANDGSFRCSQGCDDTGGDGDASGASWSFSRTFNQAGTIGYHCEEHGTPTTGMRGTVIVQGAGGGGQPGTLRLSLASYSVNEAAGSAAINVQRVNGDDGAVSVHYSAAAGTAAAGQDFTAVSGTLSWADNDDDNKSFNVPIANDTAAEANETILLTLSSPAGGAALDNTAKTATLTIQDNDSSPGGTPAAPSNLLAVAQGASEIELTWKDNSSNETGFRIERRTIGGAYQEVATAGVNATGAPISGLDPSTFYLFRVRASGGGSINSAFSNEAGTATLGLISPCVADSENLCLNSGRFRVALDWRFPGGTTGAGQAVPLAFAADSGLFYFISPSNLEMLVKVLNACVPPLGNKYWVFYSATTNVEFAVVVTDTQTGKTRGYYNPLNRPAPPVQDVSAFATCP